LYLWLQWYPATLHGPSSPGSCYISRTHQMIS
jgi:hypothetical protein